MSSFSSPAFRLNSETYQSHLKWNEFRRLLSCLEKEKSFVSVSWLLEKELIPQMTWKIYFAFCLKPE